MDIKDEPIKASVDAQDVASDISDTPQTQLELIQQWRSTLDCLKVDTGFTSVVDATTGKINEQLLTIFEAVEYLDQKNDLLDEDDDFMLSDSGFSKYQTKHMVVFDYLSQLAKPDDTNSNSKFHLVSRSKQIKQQEKASHWFHSLVHFLFIPVALLVLGVASLLMVKQTQQNLIVIFLLLWLCFLHLKTASQLLKPFKKTAVTPFRFSVSLLGIHSLNTLLKVSFLCFVPIIATAYYKHYWVDDVIIISLSVLCLFHFKPDNKQQEQVVLSTTTNKESADV